MRKTKWILKTSEEIEENSGLNLDKDIIKVLANRGIVGKENIEKFIFAGVENLENPSNFFDVDRAVERLIEAKERNENIWVYGDYDVDGITSVSLVYLALKELGFNISYYIPLRDEGYGLNIEALKEISDKGADLVITVDCGISSHKEIEYANKLGLQVIITDHHEINHGCPSAYAVINPKREENKSSFKSLAGVGTAFIMILALYKKLGKMGEAYKFLDIVAIGTVADIVPLVGDNRIFVKKGLELLKNSYWPGLRVLLRELFENYREREYTPYDIGYIIGPVFNAAGRLEDAKKAVEIFLSEDREYLFERSRELIKQNSERKNIQEEILKKCQKEIEEKGLEKRNTLVLASEGFHHGVIGIVASKLMDQYYRPIVVMEIKPEEGTAVASCRSIENFNIVEALNSMSELFTKYGGHAAAAGFSIPIENIELFTQKLEELAIKNLKEEDFYKNIKIDKELPLYKLNYELLNKLSLLEPYGFGNPSPLFLLKGCGYNNLRKIGKEKNHLMLNLVKNGLEIKNAVWFGAEDMFEYITKNPKLDIVCKLKLESYKDKYQVKAFLEDVKPEEEHFENKFEEYCNLYEMQFPMEAVVYTRQKVDGKNLSLFFGEKEIAVIENKSIIGSLDETTAYILRKLKEFYGYEFKVKFKESILKEENFNIHISIEKGEEFSTYSMKPAEIFREIKEYLLGKFEYNSLQKKILATIFKEGKNTLAVVEKGRGIDTIIKTIELYCQSFGKKALLLSDENLKEFEKGYDYYIYLNRECNNSDEGISLIFTQDRELNLENFKRIEDSYKYPENIEIVEEKELSKHVDIYSKKLPNELRYDIYKNLGNYKKLYATQDIKVLL
jgi:single-stranded-DNA-specific exonuclease